MSKAVNSKWKKTFPDTIGNQNRPATGVDDTQEFETGAFPQYMANDPVRYDLQNAAMSQLMSNDARLKEMVDARGKELDDHKVDPGAHKTGIAGNAATATKVVTTAATGASANIAEASMGGSDSARIRVSGAENAGELALETANDGDEAIVARQYTGVYTNAVRTAKILDESGNTSFPGTVVAPKFTGTLNGNASTATKLATPRTLSLSGKAAGSTSFDGSANASINVTSVNADTATKLSTARKISITGNATGAAAFDGSADANISVTVNESKHAAAADTATKVNATATNGGAADLVFGTMAANDYARIRVGGSDDNGWLELATADGGNEPIYARQYGGAYDWPNGRPGTVKNEAVLLDGNGNTKFPHDVTAANFKGHLAGNADTATKATTAAACSGNSATATKLQTPRTISLTGNASGSGTFDGSGNVSINTTVSQAANAERIRGESFWSNNNNYLLIGTLTIGQNGGAFGIKIQSGNFFNDGIESLSREASLYFRASNGSAAKYSAYAEYHRYGSSGMNFFINETSDNTYDIYLGPLMWSGNSICIPILSTACSFDKKYTNVSALPTGAKQVNSYQLVYTDTVNNYAPTKTGSGASGTWDISITGNADKLDGYHASDLLRTLGGNRTPVITDIFDRAGTIDMSTMSAADKATHKANINKAPNMTQNIWNNGSGIHAYGGDADIAGYNRGTLKLTQSYKNFDKILVVGVNDRGDLLIYKLWDVWALANAFASGSHFQLFHGGDYWFLYGSTRKGTNTNYVLSTDTVWSCQDQNSGIIAIYGIKY